MQNDPEGDHTVVVLVAALGNEGGGLTKKHPLPLLLQRYLHKLKYGFWIISEKEAALEEAGIINFDNVPVAHRVDYYINPWANAFHEAPMPVHSAMGLESFATWLSEVSIIHTSFFYGGAMLRAKELLHEFGGLWRLLGPPMRGTEGRREELEMYIRHFDLVQEDRFFVNGDNRTTMAVLEPHPFPTLHWRVPHMYAALENFLRTQHEAFRYLADAPRADPLTHVEPSPSIELRNGARHDIYDPPAYGIPYHPDQWPQVQPWPYPPYGSGDVTLLGDIAEDYQFSIERHGGHVSSPQHENGGEHEYRYEDEDEDEEMLMLLSRPRSRSRTPPPPFAEE